MGSSVSSKIQKEIMSQSEPKILLIRSGKAERYWAHVSDVSNDTPKDFEVPEYYRDDRYTFKTWFKIVRFEIAEKDVMSRYIVASSLSLLGSVSKHSMSPYFVIASREDVHEL